MFAVPAALVLLQRAIIVCPTSLVSNWDSECAKWLKGRCRYDGMQQLFVLSISETTACVIADGHLHALLHADIQLLQNMLHRLAVDAPKSAGQCPPQQAAHTCLCTRLC
jgi:hypothetical protein